MVFSNHKLTIPSHCAVPGLPRDVEVRSLNSTAVSVRWKPPANRDRNGLIRGYQIHVQEMNREGDLVNQPVRYDVAEEEAEECNVTGLQPATNYSIQVAAVTRKGDGTRSRAVTVETQGGGEFCLLAVIVLYGSREIAEKRITIKI